MNNTKKNIFKGTLWTFGGTGIQVILQFLVFVILSRLLEPESFGVMSTALALITVLSIFSKLGIGPSIVQKEIIRNEHIQTGYTISLIFSLLLTITVWVIAPSVSLFFKMNELQYVLQALAVVHLLQGFSIVSESLLQRRLQFKKLSIVQISSYLVYGVVGILLSVLGLGVWALVWAYITNVAIKTLMYLKLQSHSKRININFAVAKELLVFGSGYSIGTIYNQMALKGDTFTIGKFLGASELGIYSRAYQLFAIPVNLVGTVIEKVLFPSFSRIKSNVNELQQIYKSSMTLVAVICIPISMFLMIVGKEIISFLFGSKWFPAVLPFKILIIALLPRVSYKISDSVTKSQGKVYKSANRQFVYGLCVVIGVLIGQIYGLAGASIGVLFAIVINYIYMAQIALSLSGLKWKDFLKTHIPALNLSIVSIIPTYGISIIIRLLHGDNFTILFFTGIVFSSITLTAIYYAPQFIFKDSQKILIKILQQLKIKQVK